MLRNIFAHGQKDVPSKATGSVALAREFKKWIAFFHESLHIFEFDTLHLQSQKTRALALGDMGKDTTIKRKK
jgi:hypothetical protein